MRGGDRGIAVQLKRYGTGGVGVDAVQAAFAGAAYHGVEEAWVVATSQFTRSAVRLGETIGVRLVDREELLGWLYDWAPPGP